MTFEIHKEVEDRKKAIENLRKQQTELQKELRDKLNDKFLADRLRKHQEDIRKTSNALFIVQKDLQDKVTQYYSMQEYHHPDEFNE